MARLFQVEVPAANPSVDSVPINLCGKTLLSCPSGQLELALDPTDFNTNQFYTLSDAAPQVLPIGSNRTILWVRQPPLTGVPEPITLSVWTEIDAGDY